MIPRFGMSNRQRFGRSDQVLTLAYIILHIRTMEAEISNKQLSVEADLPEHWTSTGICI